MTLDDLLQLLLLAVDDSGRVFRHRDVSEWPEGGMEFFVQLGILRRGSGSLMAECSNCAEPHLERVVVLDDANGSSRMFIPCRESMRVEVTPEMCVCWEVDPAGLAKMIATALDLNKAPKSLQNNRLWRLGRIPWHGKSRDVLFARLLCDTDASDTLCKVPRGGGSIVIVPHQIPDDRVWPGRVPAVVSLESLVILDKDKLMIDGVAFMESITNADTEIADRGQVSLDQTSKAKVHKEVKSVIENMIGPERLVQGYRMYGSINKAVVGLKNEGVITNRSAVHRAVIKAGGTDVVLAMVDSASISRSVPSQPRDRGKNYDQRTK